MLATTWHTSSAEVTLTEGMVADVSGDLLPQLVLVRRVECRGDGAKLRVRFDPRLGFGGRPRRSARRAGALVCEWGALATSLQSWPDLGLRPGRDASFDLEPGSAATFVLTVAHGHPVVLVDARRAVGLLEREVGWWREWAGRIEYEGTLRDMVARSLAVLRLLTYSPSGAPVAAPTTSLPEVLGGDRNWDYRYAWLRDAAIGVDTFLGVGMPVESEAFLSWLVHGTRLLRPALRPAYRLSGRPVPEDREVRGVAGYRGSSPVVTGNSAARQHQLDLYGWLLDAAWRRVETGRRLDSDTWRAMRKFADYAADHWREEDTGIWEVRLHQEHHVHSKFMLWAALDRALSIARSHPHRADAVRRWATERDAIARALRERGFDEDRGTYVEAFGSGDLDGSLLLLAGLGLEDRRSERLAGTVEAVRRELDAGGGLVYRFPQDASPFEGREGAFVACSFWLVRALAVLGRVDEAGERLERLSGRANDLGLFAEEIDPTTGEHLGNFPLALSHSALVQAALTLERARRGEELQPDPERPTGSAGTS